MTATLGTTPPRGEGWAFELKWDGIRGLAYVVGGDVRVLTRNGNDVTRRYPELEGLGAALAGHDAVLDGEIVAFDESGRPSFERLQRRMHVSDPAAIGRLRVEVPVVYVLFDLLWLDGRLLVDEPYRERRALLSSLALDGPSWRTPPYEAGDGHTTIALSERYGLEGYVAKRLDSPYEPGRRSRAWVKVKRRHRQELVVGGWLPGEGARHGTVGSLLVGYHEPDADGAVRLRYAGRVGSGLRQADLRELSRLFERCARDTSPFGAGTPPKGARWVEPVLVVEVEFAHWTASGGIRAPVFVGYRTDKPPEEVVREEPA
ncbi:MAG: ATP-dependent DNA ligase [Acidimicrobiia bacterium]|nr:MAG: ATP-dependent DNA ligase [Acidimicrobiia bacterium]